jgi:hypothetical protein
MSLDFGSELVPFIKAYVICIGAFAHAFNAVHDPGQSEPIRGTLPSPWLPLDAWSIDERRKAFELLAGIFKSGLSSEIPTGAALESLLQGIAIFDRKFKVSPAFYDLFLELEGKKLKVVRHILLYHRDLLFPDFVLGSITRSGDQGFYFFSAVADMFCGTSEISTAELSHDDLESNTFLVVISGQMRLVALIMLWSPHEESRKIAYDLLVRTSPIFGGFMNPKELAPSAAVNLYLRAHKAELCKLAFPASPDQLFELAGVYAKHLPFLTMQVFSEFQTNEFVRTNPQIINSLLNAVAPFARNISITGTPSIPSNYQMPSPLTAFGFITLFISCFPYLHKQFTWHIHACSRRSATTRQMRCHSARSS